jgi:hypothetical protein
MKITTCTQGYLNDSRSPEDANDGKHVAWLQGTRDRSRGNRLRGAHLRLPRAWLMQGRGLMGADLGVSWVFGGRSPGCGNVNGMEWRGTVGGKVKVGRSCFVVGGIGRGCANVICCMNARGMIRFYDMHSL